MKKLCICLLLGFVVLAAVSCRRAAERAAQKIRIEAVEEFRLRGMTGADIVLRVANGTGHKLQLERFEVSLYYGNSRCATIRLHERVKVGKRTVESVTTRWKFKADDPLALLLLVRDLYANDLSKISISYAIEGRGGPARVNIAREKVPFFDFLVIFGLTLQEVQQYLRPTEN